MKNGITSAIAEFVDFEAVPSLPSSVIRVQECLKGEHSSVAEIAELIGHDIGLSARVLKLANSLIYSRSGNKISSLLDGVVRIGLKETEAVCLSIGMSSQFNGECEHVDLVELFKHSLSVAFATGAVLSFCRAEQCKQLSADTLYTAGLMHDLGHVVIDKQQPELYSNVFNEHSQNSEKFHRLEKVILGFGHAEVSAMIVSKWGLPVQLAKIIEFHHDHEAAPLEYRTYAQVLHIADCICNQQGYSDNIEGRIEPFDVSAWYDLALNDEDIPAIIELINEKIEKATLFAALAQ